MEGTREASGVKPGEGESSDAVLVVVLAAHRHVAPLHILVRRLAHVTRVDSCDGEKSSGSLSKFTFKILQIQQSQLIIDSYS